MGGEQTVTQRRPRPGEGGRGQATTHAEPLSRRAARKGRRERGRRIFHKTAGWYRWEVKTDRPTGTEISHRHMDTQTHTSPWGWDKQRNGHLMRPHQMGGQGRGRQTDGHTRRAGGWGREDTGPGSHGSHSKGSTGLGTRWEEPQGGEAGERARDGPQTGGRTEQHLPAPALPLSLALRLYLCFSVSLFLSLSLQSIAFWSPGEKTWRSRVERKIQTCARVCVCVSAPAHVPPARIL